MKILATKTFSDDVGVATYAMSTPIKRIVRDLGVEGEECYLYATETEAVAAQVATDATPADEWIFIGRYNPGVSE